MLLTAIIAELLKDVSLALVKGFDAARPVTHCSSGSLPHA